MKRDLKPCIAIISWRGPTSRDNTGTIRVHDEGAPVVCFQPTFLFRVTLTLYDSAEVRIERIYLSSRLASRTCFRTKTPGRACSSLGQARLPVVQFSFLFYTPSAYQSTLGLILTRTANFPPSSPSPWEQKMLLGPRDRICSICLILRVNVGPSSPFAYRAY
jgi:hypothetical protein